MLKIMRGKWSKSPAAAIDDKKAAITGRLLFCAGDPGEDQQE